MLERLDEHQRAVLAIMNGGEALLTGNARPVVEIARARWALTRALTAYQLFKHHEIFDPVIAGNTGADAVRAARMKKACLALGEDWKRYVQRWSATDVDGQWSTFQPAALTMIGRIRGHIARERVEAAALLGGRR